MLCWEVAWRVSVVCYDLDFFCVIMGFAHPQPNSLQIQSDYGKKHNFMPFKSWLNQQYTACSVSFNPNQLSSTVVGVVFIRMSK